MHHFYVYILSAKSRVLYTGITDDIYRRTWEHKNDINPGFTSDYKVHRLVYYETFKYANKRHCPRKIDQGMAAAKENYAD
jgi:putative endonuclease